MNFCKTIHMTLLITIILNTIQGISRAYPGLIQGYNQGLSRAYK